jgi:lipopolysaccharide export system permease protein
MGHLATTGQLLIFRVAGFSILKITWITVKNAFFFIIALIIFGELLVPILTKYSESARSNALGNQSLSLSQNGFWIRDGNNFINVENNVDGQIFTEITVIETNSSNEIERLIKSKNAKFDGNSLDMSSNEIFTINTSGKIDNISLKERNSYNKTVTFDSDLIDSLEKEPEELKTWAIVKKIQFLSNNKLKSKLYEVELYKRLVKPLTLIAMILMAMLFIFGSTRETTLGRKIFFGVALGLSFELLSRIGGALALSFEFSPLISSIAPAGVVIGISITLLIQKSMS